MSIINVALKSPDHPRAQFFCPQCSRRLGCLVQLSTDDGEADWPVDVPPFRCQCGHVIRLHILGWQLNPTCENPARLSNLADAIPILERTLAQQ